MTEQAKVHYTLPEIFAMFPEYRSLEYFRADVLPRLYEAGFPKPQPYSTRVNLFFPKTLVDAYLRPDPNRAREMGADQTKTDWARELVDRAEGDA